MDTIKTIAQKAGVSISTVSRVMNKNRPVTPELYSRVLEVLKQSNYTPSTAARALSSNKTNAIGIMVNNLHDPFFHDLLLGFESGARDTDYKVVFCSSLGKDSLERQKYFHYLRSGVVDGIILYGMYLPDEESIIELSLSGFPLFLIENSIDTITTHNFLVNNQKGITDAVEYLYNKGHRRIAYIAGRQDKKVCVERLKYYFDVTSSLNIKVPNTYVQFIEENSSDGAIIIDRLLSLSKEQRPTAVLCYDDTVAAHAIKMAVSRGYKIPKDVSIMGYDNQSILPLEYSGPRITSVQQPLFEMAYDSVVLFSQHLKNKYNNQINRIYDTHIIEKDSVAAIG